MRKSGLAGHGRLPYCAIIRQHNLETPFTYTLGLARAFPAMQVPLPSVHFLPLPSLLPPPHFSFLLPPSVPPFLPHQQRFQPEPGATFSELGPRILNLSS